VTGEVGFGKQVQTSYAAGLRELMPQRFADDAQSEIGYDFFADTANYFDIAKEVRRTAFRVYQPLSAKIHDDCLRNSDYKR
jgi:hypothetical protein